MNKSKSTTGASGSVDVRMFRHGFGDCFLLSFSGGRRPFNMLVDCGLLKMKNAREESRRLAEVADCIHELVPEKHIDVLVLSHAHYDHVSGFLPNRKALEIFKTMTFGELWMPWTEDPDDDGAARGIKQRRLRLLALLASTNALEDTSHPIAPLLDYYGAFGSIGSLTDSSTIKVGSELAINTVRTELIPDKSKHRYWRAGKSIVLPQAGGARVYFLGPASPSDAANASYRPATRLEVNQEQGQLIAAIEQRIGRDKTKSLLSRFDIQFNETRELSELSIPFEPNWRFAKMNKFDVDRTQQNNPKKPLGGKKKAAPPEKTAEEALRDYVDWDEQDAPHEERRGFTDVETDTSVEQVIRLDETTNQTSLVMAIELPESKKVLLFPGDAPSTDWDKWQNLTWPKVGPYAFGEISGTELFSKTILYKVSQRGCATGTSDADGLSQLNRDLIALLPTDPSTAKERGWNLPFPPVVDALLARTNNRLITADTRRFGEIEFDKKPTKLLGSRFVRVTIDDCR